MGRTKTLVQLRTAIRQQADQENSTFVSDTELNTIINTSLAQFHNILADKFGEDYYYTKSTLTATIGTDVVSLPSDFTKLLQVEINRGSNEPPIIMKQYMLKEKHKNYNSASQYSYRYRVMGTNLVLDRAAKSAFTMNLYYVPNFVDLASDGNSFNFMGDGWEDWVIMDCAAKIKAKEESDVSFELNQKAIVENKINTQALNRVLAEPQRVIDIYNQYPSPYDDPDYID